MAVINDEGIATDAHEHDLLTRVRGLDDVIRRGGDHLLSLIEGTLDVAEAQRLCDEKAGVS